jgi:hypothetical protein
MPQSNKKPLVKGALKKLPLAANALGAVPYLGGVDTLLRGLASEDVDDRYKASMLGSSMIAGNLAQDAATDYVFKSAAPIINPIIDTAWTAHGDPEFRKQIDNYDSPVWQNTEADKLSMFLSQYGEFLQPKAKKLLESAAYSKTLPPVLELLGKVMSAPINAARPAVLAGVDAIIPPAGKRGIFTGQHGATGGPSFNKNPYAKK